MAETLGNLLIVGIGFAVLVGVLLLILIGWRIMYRTVKPSEADVVTGRGAHMSKETRDRLEADRQRLIEAANGDPTLLRRVPEVPDFKIVRSGGYIKQPGQVVTTVNRAIHRAAVKTTSLAKGGVPITVEATVLYRVGDSELSIARYASRFDDESAMIGAVEDVFEGKAREVLATLSVTQIQEDRESFGESVRSACTDDFDMLGLNIENFTIKEVSDSNGYLQALGEKDIAEVKKTARIATAQNEQAAAEAEAAAQAAIAEAQAQSAIQQSEATARAQEAQQTAEQAGPLAKAKAEQEVIKTQTENAKLAALYKEQELQATVIKEADAAKYQTVKNAEAAQEAAILQAEAEAAATERAAAAEANAAKLRATGVQAEGEAQAAADEARGLAVAAVNKAQGLAQAEVTKEQGLAQAAATEAEGLARAAGLAAEGAALTENQEAMVANKLAENLPAAIAANAQAYSNIGSMTVLDGMSGVNNGLQQTMVTALSMIPAVLGTFKPNGNGNGGGSPFDLGSIVQNFGGKLADRLPEGGNLPELLPQENGSAAANAGRTFDQAVKSQRAASRVRKAQQEASGAFEAVGDALDTADGLVEQAEGLRDRVGQLTN